MNYMIEIQDLFKKILFEKTDLKSGCYQEIYDNFGGFYVDYTTMSIWKFALTF